MGKDAHRIIEIARDFGALGWKVNGAGGNGGSLTLLTSDLSSRKRKFIRAVEATKPGFQSLPIYLSRGSLQLCSSS
ncbi:MAG: hypothetical protein VX733_08000 [Candidatus Latescibacterota bacterium]|nr:hypothetical protein [Candidatus Latescibacterota bacterium]